VSEWQLVAEYAELARRKKKQVMVAGEPVALFVVGGRVFALQDTCIHKQRSLSQGTILNGRVVCPGHQWTFDVETGYVAEQERCQPSYDVRVEDGHVYVSTESQIRVHDYDGIGSV
jgi:nitrite reductase/ring-hydroxylating ferredoxin subunit